MFNNSPYIVFGHSIDIYVRPIWWTRPNSISPLKKSLKLRFIYYRFSSVYSLLHSLALTRTKSNEWQSARQSNAMQGAWNWEWIGLATARIFGPSKLTASPFLLHAWGHHARRIHIADTPARECTYPCHRVVEGFFNKIHMLAALVCLIGFGPDDWAHNSLRQID